MTFYATNSPMVTLLVVAAIGFLRDQFPCHALCRPPSYAHLATATPTSASLSSPIRTIRHYVHRKTRVQTRLSNIDEFIIHHDDEWDDDDDAASQAILSGIPNSSSIFKNIATCVISTMHPTSNIVQSIKNGYAHRIAADPTFLTKSVVEIVLAAVTQYMAEVGRRGKDRILPEFDFVFAGVLTAVCGKYSSWVGAQYLNRTILINLTTILSGRLCHREHVCFFAGKYYSMWRVARTVDAHHTKSSDAMESNSNDSTTSIKVIDDWRDKVPTNAFQPTLFDGHTSPSLSSRILAFILPMPQLFRAGVIASTIGYGLTSILIRARSLLAPQYRVVTEPVPVVLAALYTGLFMAFVSNVRYQILQGIVEPFLFSMTEKLSNRIGSWVTVVGKLAVLIVRYANGVLGSWIAIGGMRAVGLQKLKMG
jgi:hypothetical protein